MAGVKLSELATTTVIEGDELVTILQDGWNRNTTIQSIIGPTHTIAQNNTTLLYNLSTTIDQRVASLSNDIYTLSGELTSNTTSLTADISTIYADIDILTYTISSLGVNLTDDITDLTTTFKANTATTSSRLSILTTDLNTLSSSHYSDVSGIVQQLSSINTELNQPKVSVSPIFITDVTNSTGLITKVWKPSTVPLNHIVDSVTVDSTTSLAVYFEWDGPDDEWMGEASINDVVIPSQDITRIGNTRRFQSSSNLTNVTGITARANGGEHVVPITLLGQGPGVTNITFGSPPTTNGYQPAMFLDGDTVQVTAEFDTDDVDTITLYSGSSFATSSTVDQPVVTTGTPASATFTATIDTQSTTINNQPIKISAKNAFGTEGAEYTSTSTIPVRAGPEILSMTFGAYPGNQTELKNNDTVDITVEFDTNAVTQVGFYNSNSYANDGSTRSVTPNNRQVTTTLKIGTNATTVQNLPVRARSRGSSSNWGNFTNSTSTVAVNNAYPTFSGYSVVYNSGELALKWTESADVTLNVANQGASPTYTYSSTTGDVAISNTSTYAATKTVDCTNPGVYRPNTNNYRLTVNRVENDATATYNGVIKIADIAPNLTVSYPGTRLRSGGNNGTTVQTYQIQVNSNQQLQSFNMSADSSAGTLDGSWVGSSSNTIYRRNLKVSDDDDKGTFTWQFPSGKNLAGITANSFSSGSTYILGGFVSRTLTVPSQGWQVTADVEAVTYNNVQISWTKKDLTTRASVGDTTRPQTSTWSLNRLSPSPITVNILDSGATNASSVATQLTIEEVE
jgi:hypothetical protein